MKKHKNKSLTGEANWSKDINRFWRLKEVQHQDNKKMLLADAEEYQRMCNE